MAGHAPNRDTAAEGGNPDATKRSDEARENDPGTERSGAMKILTSIGEVIYEWAVTEDVMRWGANALDVLQVGSFNAIASGRKYSALLDSNSVTTPQESVAKSTHTDSGTGVPYRLEYELRPLGPGDPRKLWVEDTGRWFAGSDGRPARAHGVLRVIDARREEDYKRAYLNRFDSLTGEMNRARLVDVLETAIDTGRRRRASCAFLMISLDGLGAINETYGFDVADEIIVKVSSRIRSRLRGADSLGRFSGSKFGVVLMNCGRDDIEIAAERFLAAVSDEVITTEHGTVAATVTIGGACAPVDARSAQEAAAFAQEALDEARSKGCGGFACYLPSRSRATSRQANRTVSADILEGLNEHRLRLAYQPVLSIEAKTVGFHECLMRLEQSDGTVVPASRLIPVAEKLGLVRLIDHRMLKLVLDELVHYPQARLSLNVSPQTAIARDWLDTLTACLRQMPDGVAARLIVEITETAAIENLRETGAFIAAVRDLGAKIAIDDFGAGPMSLRALKNLDLDFIKIDGSLVENLASSKEDRIIVRALVDLAKGFSAETVAEWVSDSASVELLSEMGVSYLQGNHLAGAAMARPWTNETRLACGESAGRAA